MKKIFTLLTLMLLTLTASAGDVFTITFNGKNAETKNGEEVTAGTFFTWNTAKHNFNSKFNGASWNGIDFTSGLKMEGATKVSFQSAAESKVTIVASTWSSKTIKFDDEELVWDGGEDGTGCKIFTLTSVAGGNHSVTRGSGENGIFAVQVEYTGEVKTKLTNPEVTFDENSGQVTIGAVENATAIKYTTDGSEPTAENGEAYSAPFTVADGVIVKAVAIGEGNYISSDIVSVQVLIAGTVPAVPVIKTLNGTVAISCETAASEIEYSTDGASFKTYARAFTLEADGKVYARASRGSKTSEVAEQSVTIAAQPNDVQTVTISGSTVGTDANEVDGSDEAKGFKLAITGNTEKKWSVGNAIMAAGYEETTLKVSNGAQNTLTLPEGKQAVRVTFVSYVNAAASTARTSGWKEVNGVEYDVKEVPMGAFTSVTDYATEPDVRVFLLPGVNSFTFTNTGEQLCFVAIVDIATEKTVIPDVTGISTVKAAQANDAVIYNLAGQKVTESYKGVVIKNGKKVVIK